MLAFMLLLACNRPNIDSVLKDPRNIGVSVSIDCKEYLSCNNLIFDVVKVTGSKLDVSRVLFQFAETQKLNTYDNVYLASKGVLKFYVPGTYFKYLGDNYATENPIYILNHFPENVKRLDGTPAFETWEGGWLGVATQQLNDINDLHNQWWAL